MSQYGIKRWKCTTENIDDIARQVVFELDRAKDENLDQLSDEISKSLNTADKFSTVKYLKFSQKPMHMLLGDENELVRKLDLAMSVCMG